MRRFWSTRRQDDFVAEIDAHLRLEADRLMREQGRSEGDALAQARKTFGNVGVARERFYSARRLMWLDHLRRDVVYALRALQRSPGYTAVVLITLSLGIACVATVFSVVNTAVFRPLPYPDANRIFALEEYRRSGWYNFSDMSEAAIGELRRTSRAFERFAISEDHDGNVSNGAETVPVLGQAVDTALFPLLGVRPERGRLFALDEYADASPVVLISDVLWRTMFGADEHLVGKAIRVNQRLMTVVGILPPQFRHPYQTDLWFPLRERASFTSDRDYSVLAKLRPGASLKSARAETARIGPNLAAADPTQFPGDTVVVQNGMVDRGPQLVAIFAAPFIGAAICVLLIACANIGGLSMVRAVERRREMAIRASLGGSASRLFTQNITESLLLGLIGGLMGAILSVWGIKLVSGLVPLYGLPSWVTLGVDGRVLTFALLLGLLTTVAFGLAPARQAMRIDLVRSLKAGGDSTTAGGVDRRGARRQVAGELALALMLFLSASLLWQASRKLADFDYGFTRNKILSVFMSRINPNQNDPVAEMRAANDIASELARHPGVAAAAVDAGFDGLVAGEGATHGTGAGVPLSTVQATENDRDLYVATGLGRRLDPALQRRLEENVVSRDFQRVMGLSLRRGRWFDVSDDASSAPVAVLGERLAQSLWPAEAPIGKTFRIGAHGADITVIGIVSDVRTPEMEMGAVPVPSATPSLYMIDRQAFGWNAFVRVRARGDAKALIGIVPVAIHTSNPDQPIDPRSIRLLEEDTGGDVDLVMHLAGLIMGIFACGALAMAVVGTYGVIAYTVTQRTREIGIRLALGAETSDVILDVMRDSARFIGIGLGVGLVLALGIAQVIRFMLWGVSPFDPATYLVVVAGFGAVALLACYIPSRRVTRIDPLTALKSD